MISAWHDRALALFFLIPGATARPPGGAHTRPSTIGVAARSGRPRGRTTASDRGQHAIQRMKNCQPLEITVIADDHLTAVMRAALQLPVEKRNRLLQLIAHRLKLPASHYSQSDLDNAVRIAVRQAATWCPSPSIGKSPITCVAAIT